MVRPDALPVVVSAQWQVRQQLRALGLTHEIVRAVATAAVGARADALAIDPAGTPGTLSYIHGVRAIRLNLLPLGWRPSRNGNVESTVNDKLGVQICFQNVDVACGVKDPEAISGKGAASRTLVRSGQGELFEKNDHDDEDQVGVSPTVWLICVSPKEDGFDVEVSCPRAFDGNQFDGFVRRLFILEESGGTKSPKLKESDDGDDGLQFDIAISRK